MYIQESDVMIIISTYSKPLEKIGKLGNVNVHLEEFDLM